MRKGLKIHGRSTWKSWIPAGVKDGPADCIRIDEIAAALKKMKRHKAPGLSGLVAEMIQATRDIGTHCLYFAPENPQDGKMYLLVPAHSGCPGQSPKSCKMVVCACVWLLLLYSWPCDCVTVMLSQLHNNQLCLLWVILLTFYTEICYPANFSRVIWAVNLLLWIWMGWERHNLGTTAKQVAMVWAYTAKRRQWLGEEMYGVWSEGYQAKK